MTDPKKPDAHALTDALTERLAAPTQGRRLTPWQTARFLAGSEVRKAIDTLPPAARDAFHNKLLPR